jgi:hypothetical protein
MFFFVVFFFLSIGVKRVKTYVEAEEEHGLSSLNVLDDFHIPGRMVAIQETGHELRNSTGELLLVSWRRLGNV